MTRTAFMKFHIFMKYYIHTQQNISQQSKLIIIVKAIQALINEMSNNPNLNDIQYMDRF